MKKLLFIIAVVSLLFSCGETKFYSVSITNNTAKTVSYTYNNNSETLAASETKSYEVQAYTLPPRNIIDEDGIASLEIKKDNLKDEYTITDAPSLDLKVINNLPFEITVKADNFIDNGDDNSEDRTELEIKANSESTSAKIYTRNPKFASTSDYPLNIEWAIVKVGDKEEMLVSIR